MLLLDLVVLSTDNPVPAQVHRLMTEAIRLWIRYRLKSSADIYGNSNSSSSIKNNNYQTEVLPITKLIDEATEVKKEKMKALATSLTSGNSWKSMPV